jgi:hypothetical protein
MKISITSDVPVQKYYIKDLNSKKYAFELDKNFEVPYGWYELIVDYVDTKIEITDIKINDGSIKHLLYTGFYTDGKGKIHQPATAVWDKGGFFSIWIHTELGVMFQRIMEAIKNGDYGQNLFKDYTLTVDRSHIAKDFWPPHIKSFFKNAHGPQWWPLRHTSTPWMRCDIGDIDTDELLTDLEDFCYHHWAKKEGYEIRMHKNGASEMPFVEISDIKSKTIRKLLTSIGYTRLIDITVQTLAPGVFIDIHRDDHYKRKAYPYMKGCKKFYWTCKNAEGVHFKLGRSGFLPHNEPLLINTIEQPHAVINEGPNTKTSILIYGEIPE